MDQQITTTAVGKPDRGSNYRVFIGLLGRFRLVILGKPATLHGQKFEQLLVTLILRHGRPVLRSQLLQSIWPDVDSELAGQSLNTLVYNLRRLLRDALDGQSIIICDDGSYQLNLEAGVGVDILIFSHRIAEGKRLHQQGDITAAKALFLEAIQLYTGDLIETDSIESTIERQRLRSQYLDALRSLAAIAIDEKDWERGLDYGHLALKADACLEEAHRTLMRCYAALGQRIQAIRQYELCRAVLQQELNISPEAETERLYRELRGS